MTLQPDPNTPGLWVNSEWRDGDAGTFAVVIGISQYTNLAGGANPGQNNFGLGQLYVSALTAYRFFLWLRDTYSYTNCPLAKCWILLSPTQDEIATEPAIAQHMQDPTFMNCSDSINSWFSTLRQLALPQAQQSRAFFFFSGHGLEISINKQILLPSDYLRPPGLNLNWALSTENLSDGVAVLKVPQMFFFVDACRNDHEQLRAVDIEGTDVLNNLQAFTSNPERNAPILYSSASGTQAWQPRLPSEGPSIFGRALLDGLHAREGFKPDCSTTPCAVQFSPLHQFLRRRVMQLIQERGSTVTQYVPQGGYCLDPFASVTQVQVTDAGRGTAVTPDIPDGIGPVVGGAVAGGIVGGVVAGGVGGLIGAGAGAAVGRIVGSAGGSTKDAEGVSAHELIERMYDTRLQVGTLNVARDGDATAHNALGSEQVTQMWREARTFNLQRRVWLPNSSAYEIHNVERSGTNVYRIELSIPGQLSNYWLELSDGTRTFACLLPRDASGRPRYQIELIRNSDDGQLIRVEAGLSQRNEGSLGQVAAMWEKYRLVSVAEAADSIDMQFAEEALRGKARSPLAAMVAAIILLRAQRYDLVHDWLSNLADWFDYLPDGPVLRVEQLIRHPDNAVLHNRDHARDHAQATEAMRWIMELPQRGLPFTGEGVTYAEQQVRLLMQFQPLGNQPANLQHIHDWLREVMRFFRPGSLFTVLQGHSGQLKPELVSSRSLG